MENGEKQSLGCQIGVRGSRLKWGVQCVRGPGTEQGQRVGEDLWRLDHSGEGRQELSRGVEVLRSVEKAGELEGGSGDGGMFQGNVGGQ